jgi:hypothetical protein
VEAQALRRSQNGFGEAHRILEQIGLLDPKRRFVDFEMATNILKCAAGRSYVNLVPHVKVLAFRSNVPGEPFFREGDVPQVNALVQVDDRFVRAFADVFADVDAAIRGAASRISPDLSLERTACTGRRSAAREYSAPRRPVQAAVQRRRQAP